MILDPGIPYKGIQLKLAEAVQEAKFELGDKDQFALEMDHFGQCVKSGDTPATPNEEGLKDVSIMMKSTKPRARARV